MLVHGARRATLHGVLLGCLTVGACAYHADSFSYSSEPFRGIYVTVECLDLAIEKRATPDNSNSVVAYEFGNRCDEPTLVDLASARLVGHTVGGGTIDLVAYDPDREIRPLQLDARAVGREAIAYSSDLEIQGICVDAASIAHTSPPRWLCFH